MLKEFSAFHRRNLEDPWGDYSGYLIPSTNDAARMTWLTQLFDANGIEYGQASAPGKATGLDYADMSTHKLTISTGDLIIHAHQPQSGLLQVLMDPNPELSDSLTYDITTWALPYAYGLEAYALTTSIPSTIEWTPIVDDSNLQGDGPGYAFIIDYHTDLGTPVLAELLNKGIVVRLAKRPIVANGTTYPQGSLVITRRNNEAHWDDMAENLKSWTQGVPGLHVGRLESGMVEYGPDLGADDVAHIPAPRVAVAMGEDVSSLSFGEVWFTFEEVWGYPMTAVRDLNRINWDEYDLLVLPRGWYQLDEDVSEAISQWVREGGRIVAIGSACNLGLDEWGLTRYDDDEDEAERRDEREAHAKSDRYAPYAMSARNGIRSDIPGAVYKVNLDNTHPLAFGYEDSYWSIKTSGSRYAHLDNGHNVGIIGDNPEPISGFAGARANAQLRESLSFGVQDVGRGHVIYLADNVLFRAFWKDGHKFFANAVFFGSAM